MCKWKQGTDASSVVYLFNSAYRGTYSFNLFKIMASQNGLHAKMRYAIDRNVPWELGDKKNYSKLINHRCFIIFVNRYNDKSYEFLPLRKGIIKRIHKELGYLFIDVKLDKFISCKGNVTEFTKLLSEKLKGKKIPELKDNNPDITSDGNYIVESKENIEENIILNNDSWLTSVEYISKTKAFQEKFTFITVSVFKINKDNSFVLINPDINGVISISPSCNYVLEATYFDPTMGIGNFWFNFGFQSPINGMQNKIYCTSKVDNVSIPISSDKNISFNDKLCSIEISQVENNTEHSVLRIPCKVDSIWKDKILLLLVFMVFILSIGADLEQSQDICLALWLSLKWLVSFLLITYAGMRIF